MNSIDGIDFNACLANTSATNNVAVSVNLTHLSNGTRVTVSNGHLYWRRDAQIIRLKQQDYWTKRLAAPANQNVILCGDFNAPPNQAWYDLITGKYQNDSKVPPVEMSLTPELEREMPNPHSGSPYIQPIHIFLNGTLEKTMDYSPDESGLDFDHIRTSFSDRKVTFESSYAKALGSEPNYTNFTQFYQGTLDYIFYNNSLTVQSAMKLPVLSSFIPSETEPSDHLPIMATFALA